MLGFRALGFSTAVAFWPGLLSAATAPRWAILAAGTPLVSRLDPRRVRPSFLTGLAVLLVYAAVSLAWTPDRLTGLNEFFRLLIFAAVVAAAAGVEDIDPVLEAIGWGVAVSSVLAVLDTAGWALVDQVAADDGNRGPPAGLFFNPAVLAETAALLLVWALVRGRYLLAAALWSPLLLCHSRIAITAAVIGAVAAMPRRVLWVALPVVGLGFAMGLLGFSLLGTVKVASADQRIALWLQTIAGLNWFGHGIGSFAATEPRMEYAHSDFLQAIYELGPAAVPLVVAVLVSMRRNRLGMAAALGSTAAVSFPLHTPVGLLLAGLLVGDLGRVRLPLCRGRSYGGVEIAAGA